MNVQKTGISAQLGAMAPFVKEAWYVVALEKDFTREIKARTILGEPVIYYTTEAGAPVVLDGRCSHRRFPLEKGVLQGDNVACGYHGISFAPDGSCTYAPGCPKGAPQQMRIKSYPIAKSGPWIWLWMGRGEPDHAALPIPDGVFDKIRHFHSGYTHYAANYGLVHENLLDLTHIYFLHKAGTFEYSDAPLLPLKDQRAGWWKNEPNILSMFGMMSGAGPEPMVQYNILTEVLAPGLMYTFIDFEKIDDVDRVPGHAMVMQAITPETERSTHQFWLSGLDVPLAMSEQEFTAYTDFIHDQDVEGLALQQQMIDSDRRDEIIEISIPNDRSGLRFRQKLFTLAAEEAMAAAT